MRKNKLRVCMHFVWATWDRQPLVTGDMERDVYRFIETICADDKCDVLAIGGMADHVHLLVQLSNTITMADMMKHVKGGSSRFVTEKLTPGHWFAWQGSYGAFSVSWHDRQKVIRYIENQKEHHVNGTLWPQAEETSESVSA